MRKSKIIIRGGILATAVVSLLASLNLMALENNSTAYADDVSIQGITTQDSILSVEDAVLQKYTVEDLKATQSFLLNRPYEGNGRVIDANEDGIVNCFDMCILRRDYKEIGNYYDLLFKFMQSTEDQYSITSEDGELTSNRVIVQGTHELDFSKFSPVSIFGDSEYYYLLQFDSFSDAKNCISILENEEGVVCAQMDGYVETPPDENEQTSTVSLEIESSSLSWGVSVIEADKYASYLSENFNSQVSVAVIDTGVSKHSFINSRLLSGRDIVNNDNDPSDDHGHGTHVAGTIVDCTPGLNINILPIKVLDSGGGGSDAEVIAGIKWARQNHVDIINLSLGPGSRVPSGGAFEYAVNQAVAEGITVVKAAGNENDDTKYHSPSNASAPIVVSAIDSSLNRSVWNNGKASNYGESVDLTAPGTSIKSSTYDGGYGYKSGTSMAAPHIAAAAAMIKYQYPSYTPAQVESTLTSVCMDLGATGKDVYYGYGVPKLSSLIKSSVQPTITLSASSLTLYTGGKQTLSASVNPGDVDVKWNTSNASVATVSNGTITAQSAGTAKITAFFTYEGKTYSAACTINVKKPTISISQTSKSVYQTDTFTLTATTNPSSQSLSWSTSDASVATVSNGKVTAVGSGTATITASFIYGGTTYSASCKVTVKAVSISLNATSKTVYQTDTFTLSATTSPSGQSISWSSSDTNVATVSGGKVTAVNPGTVTITASFVYNSKTYKATCNVTVKKVSVELSASSKTLLIGETATLTATTSPTGLDVTWESSNNMVASVSDGKITAKAPGEITITASITYNGKEFTDTCAVKVSEPAIQLGYSQLKLAKNETVTMIAETYPEGLTISWSSEDVSICSISSSGVITAKAIGNTMITGSITYKGSTYSSSCNVIVGEPKVTLSKTSLSMYVTDTQSIIASVVAVDGNSVQDASSDITWITSNSSVATVSSNGAVKAVGVGSATITAKYYFCGVYYPATCKVTVTSKPDISLSKSSLSLYIGDTSTLSATVTPSGQTVSWSSSDTSVATVSNGKITAISNGTATITASFKYNGVTYSTKCSVTVVKPSITFDVTSKSIYQGDAFYIYETVKPSGQTVTWTSSDTSVASVSSNGYVTGKNAGTATITGKFTYAGNTYKATCKVTVKALSLTLSSYSGSATVDVWEESGWGNPPTRPYVLAHKVVLPTVTCSSSSASYTWEIISGSGWIGGNQNLYISQPGTITVRCTMDNNGYTVYKDYKFSLTWYKTTTDINYFYKQNPYVYGTNNYRYSFDVPNNTTVYFSEIVINGTWGESGTTIYGKCTYNGYEGWIIISAW